MDLEVIVLKVTNRCNWNCSYCDNVDNNNIDIKILIKYINLIQSFNPNIIISISGGEPGLLSKEYYNEIFKYIKKPIELATNGTFLKNDYHNIFKKYIKEIWYHVTPEIINDNNVYDIIETNIPIQYIFVIHKQNLNNVIPFIQNNKHLQFSPRFYIGEDPNLILSKEDISYLYNNGICKMNIIDGYKQRIKYFNNVEHKHIIQTQEFCNTISYIPRVDLIKKRIFRCCAGLSNKIDNVPLNNINLKLLLKFGIFKNEKYNNICSTCYNGAWNCRLDYDK